MTRYRIDSRRITLKEMRTELPLFLALVTWPISRLPIRTPSSSEYPAVDSLSHHLVSKSQLPPEALEEFQHHSPDIRALGFRGSVFHAIEDLDQQTTHHYASLLHPSGETIARMKRRVFHATTPHKKFFVTEFISKRDDGAWLITSNSRGDLETPAGCEERFLPKASIAELWEEHRRRLNEPEWRGRVRHVADAGATVDELEQLHRCIQDHFVARRVFVAVEDTASGNDPEPATEAESVSGEARQLLSEIRRQGAKRTANSTTTLLVLLLSIALFVALGGYAWSWTFALFLVPILLFHELGHFLCMKLFDYRNVRMFFIPLFGAAVSGHNYNVPGWKRVVTSLMGPVPGIVVGIGLGIVALVQGQELLLQGALIMVIVNGFNLIPALPLDGGWVVHGLLFSRHAFLDLIFRVGAIGLLFFIGLVGGGWLLFGIGAAMLIGLPAAFHVARITDRLRGEEHFPGVIDESQIPQAAIVRISEELDRAYPKGLALKIKATLVAQIFQNINSPPPGVGGTLTLGAIYLGSIGAALIGGVVLVLGQQTDLGELIAQGAFAPQRTADPGQIIRRPQGLEPHDFFASETLVANFSDRATAEAAMARLQREVGPKRRIVLFGTTLLLRLDEADTVERRESWFDRFESETAIGIGEDLASPVFVDHASDRAMLRLTCIAPDVNRAKQIETVAAGYFWSVGTLRLIAPWDGRFELTPQQQKSRGTVVELQRSPWIVANESDDEIHGQIQSARRRGRKDHLDRLLERLNQQQRERQLAYLHELRGSGAEQHDVEILDAYEQSLPPLTPSAAAPEDEDAPPRTLFPTLDDWLDGVAAKLGQLDDDLRFGNALSTQYGGVRRNGLFLDFYVTFESLPSGLLALVDWLSQQGCVTFRYEILNGSRYE